PPAKELDRDVPARSRQRELVDRDGGAEQSVDRVIGRRDGCMSAVRARVDVEGHEAAGVVHVAERRPGCGFLDVTWRFVPGGGVVGADTGEDTAPGVVEEHAVRWNRCTAAADHDVNRALAGVDDIGTGGDGPWSEGVAGQGAADRVAALVVVLMTAHHK